MWQEACVFLLILYFHSLYVITEVNQPTQEHTLLWHTMRKAEQKQKKQSQYTKAIICSLTEGPHTIICRLCKASETEDVNCGEYHQTTVCHSCHRHFYEAARAALTCWRFNYAAGYHLILWAVTLRVWWLRTLQWLSCVMSRPCETTCIDANWQTGECLHE